MLIISVMEVTERMLLFCLCVFFRDPSLVVRPRVAMSACLEAFAAPEVIEDFYSTALQAKSVAQKLVKYNGDNCMKSLYNYCCSLVGRIEMSLLLAFD